MKPVLILQHQTPEWPAYLTTWLRRHGIPYHTVNGSINKFPKSIDDYSALAVMGGGMSANDNLPSNHQAEILILQALYRDIPVVGHCLGGQLLAKALGADIVASPQPEIGWAAIEWLPSTETNAWFGPTPTKYVAQWHYESFTLPTGSVRLASTPACPNQAFSIGKHLAMQFHIEVDIEKVEAWVEEGDSKWTTARATSGSTVQSKTQILEMAESVMAEHQATASCVYKKWLQSTGYFGLS